jgi:hypothetical protein
LPECEPPPPVKNSWMTNTLRRTSSPSTRQPSQRLMSSKIRSFSTI